MTCESCPAYNALDSTCRAEPAKVYAWPVQTLSGKQSVNVSPFPPVQPSGWCMLHPQRAAMANRGIMPINPQEEA